MNEHESQVGTDAGLPATMGMTVEAEVTRAADTPRDIGAIAQQALHKATNGAEPTAEPEAEKIEQYMMSTGVLLHLKPVNPMLIKKTASTVTIPGKPTYETITMSGRKEKHFLDEQSAKETEGGEEDWANYKATLNTAQELQNDRITFIILAKGTEFTLPDDGWEEIQEISGIDIPERTIEKKVHYILTEGSTDDLGNIMTLIMRLTGVTEETIAQASDTFRGAVRDEPETTGRVDESGRDTGEASIV